MRQSATPLDARRYEREGRARCKKRETVRNWLWNQSLMATKSQEVQNLLTLLFQAGGVVRVANGHLLVSPPELAEQCRAQITRLKGEILFAMDYCPVCVTPLEYAHTQGNRGYYRLAWCAQDRSHCERATKL